MWLSYSASRTAARVTIGRYRQPMEETVVEVGQPAPDVTLYGVGNQEVPLASFRGQPVVLFFFPKAFTKT